MNIPHFAWNAETIGFWGTIFFTFLVSWGLWQQKKSIWKNQSGKSIPVALFSFSAFMTVTILLYGLSLKNLALSINGFLYALIYIPIIVGLWKFKGFTKLEKILFLSFASVTVLNIVLPFKEWFFFGFSLASMAISLMLPIEIYRNKSIGVVNIRFIVTSFVNTIFWLIYGIAIDNWILKITNPYYLILGAINIALWLKYRKS